MFLLVYAMAVESTALEHKWFGVEMLHEHVH